MGRYRPPAPPSSLYITHDGYLSLQNELNGLWKRRTAVTKALAAAAAEGDRSENAEYIYRKKELREIDRRIRYLQKRLPALKVVSEPPTDSRQIYFGAWVTLEDEQGFVAPLPVSHGPRKLAPEGFHTGPAIGERLPDFTLTDQHGRSVRLHGDRGNARAAVVFFRSAVW